MNNLSRVLRRTTASDQRGIATIEFLAAMVVLFLTVSGVLAASFSAGMIGTQGNQQARRNVLMTAFSEAIKALPYDNCTATDGSVYQAAFNSGESKVPANEDLRNARDANQLQVVSVATSPTCPATDLGTQTIVLSIKIRNTSLQRVIVKRSPTGQRQPLDVMIVNPVDRARSNDPADVAYGLLRSAVDDPQVIIGLRAEGQSAVFQYEWWCDAAHPADGQGPWLRVDTTPGQEESSAGQAMVTLLRPIPASEPKFVTSTPSDSAPECRYAAPGFGSTQHDPPILVLRVTEAGSGRTALFARTLTALPTTTTPHNAPNAQIEVNGGGPPQCITSDPCTYNTPITFRSVAPPPPDAAIILWEWNFGDGTPTSYCQPTSADPTGLSCKNPPPHTYPGGSPAGGYPVSLVVTDAFGTRSIDPPRNVIVNGPVKIRPTIQAGSGPTVTASVTVAVSPQIAQFDASGSHADGYIAGQGTPPSGITNYYWDFGTGNPGDNQSGPTLTKPTFTYPKSNQRQTFTVTVTVTDHQGLTNFATVTVILDPLVPPIGFTNNAPGLQRKGDILFIRNAYFDFQFTNVPRSPGDQIKYVVRITSAGGFCGFFGVGGYRDFVFNGGAAGTGQTYRAQFSSSPRGFNGICATDTFNYKALTKRYNPACPVDPIESVPVCLSDWSAPQNLNPEFF